MINRPDFLDLLWKWKDHDLIKVVTGVRRCGKSTVLDAFADRLAASGVPSSCILRMDFESEAFDPIRTVDEARKWLAAHRPRGKRTYVLLDEVQRVAEGRVVGVHLRALRVAHLQYRPRAPADLRLHLFYRHLYVHVISKSS